MEISFKGIKIGKLIIAHKDIVEDSIKIKLEPKEIMDWFVVAVKEGKIVFEQRITNWREKWK